MSSVFSIIMFSRGYDESEYNGLETITKSEELAGDPRFLGAVLKCVERRCRLLGLDAPTKSIVAGSADELSRLVEEARARVLKAKKKKETIHNKHKRRSGPSIRYNG